MEMVKNPMVENKEDNPINFKEDTCIQNDYHRLNRVEFSSEDKKGSSLHGSSITITSISADGNRKKYPFLLKETEPYFDTSIFLKELAINLFFPFSLVFLSNWASRFGWTLTNFRGFIYTVVIQIAFFVLIAGGFIMNQEAAISVLFIFMHRCLVALKYASLHPAEYEELTSSTNLDLIVLYNMQIQMLTGWVGLRCDVLNHEIDMACIDCGVDSEATFFVLRGKQKENFARFFDFIGLGPYRKMVESRWDGATNTTVDMLSVRAMTLAIIKSTVTADYYAVWSKRVNMVISIGLGILPFFFMHGHDYDNSDTRPIYIGFLALRCFVTIVSWNLVGLFLFSGLFDAIRKNNAARNLDKLIQLSCKFSAVQAAKDSSALPAFERLKRVKGALKRAFTKGTENTEGSNEVLIEGAPSTEMASMRPVDSDDEGDELSTSQKKEDEGPIWKDDARRFSIFGRMTEGMFGFAFNEDSVPSDWVTNSYGPASGTYDVENAAKLMSDAEKAGEAATKSVGEEVPWPTISLREVGNMSAWIYSRQLIQVFGRRWTARIDAYLGACILMNISVLIWMMYIMFSGTPTKWTGNSGAMLTSPEEEKDINPIMTTLFVSLTASVLMSLILCIIVIIVGADTNYVYEKHRAGVHLHIMAVSAELTAIHRTHDYEVQCGRIFTAEEDQARKAKTADLEEVIRIIQASSESIEVNNLIYPVRVMGVRADYSLAASIITAVATFVSTLSTTSINSSE